MLQWRDQGAEVCEKRGFASIVLFLPMLPLVSKPWEYPRLRSQINSAGGYPFLSWRGMLGLEQSLGIGPFMYVSVIVEA